MSLPTLYIKDKHGSLREWTVKVDTSGQYPTIVKSYGVRGGKITVTQKEVTSGKNIGRANETTPYEQALSEAKYLWKKQVDSGYSEKVSDTDRPPILPMLANKWEDYSHHIQIPFYVQPKLDGVRMTVGKIDGKIVMKSRTGKDVNHLDHIRNEVKDLLEEGQFLDGENFSDELSFEEITGHCRTTLESSASSKRLDKIHFHVFDTFHLDRMDEPFSVRHKRIKKINGTYVHAVSTQIVQSIEPFYKKFIDAGYEGIMVRDPSGLYELGKRSTKLLKYKEFETREYTIVGANRAEGKDKDTVVWVCELHKNGPRFNVRPKGTLQERKRMYLNSAEYIGKQLTVQFQNLSNGGIPRFPVGLAIRDYE